MYRELYEYLLLHKQLTMPGIGTFSLERTPARIHFPDKLVYPPVYNIKLSENTVSPPGQFYQWLGGALHITDRDAVIRFNDFVFEMKKQIGEGDTIHWSGVGTVKKGLAGEIRFLPDEPAVREDPVTAEKLLREKAEHWVKVGETEKTSAEMEAMLALPEEKKSWWWVYALGVGLLAVIFTGWYLSENGLATGSVANSRKLVPVESTASYRSLP